MSPITSGIGGAGLDRFAGRRPTHFEKKDRPGLGQRLSQTGATRGTRSGKSGQSNHFVGYKKHTLCGLTLRQGRFCLLPLISLVRAANINDVEMLLPLLQEMRTRLAGIWPVGFVIGDRGYIGAEQARRLRRDWQIALIVAPRIDMRPPQGCNEAGCPLCPLGERLVWEDYDTQDGGVLIYRGQSDQCEKCPLAGTCPRQFEFGAECHETFWGMVPSHSHLSQQLLRWFRPRVEAGFNVAKNKHRLKGFFVNSLGLTQTLCVMSDVLMVMEFLADQRPVQKRQMKKTIMCNLKSPEFWD